MNSNERSGRIDDNVIRTERVFVLWFSGNCYPNSNIMIGGCVHLRLFWGDAETCYSRTNRRTGKVGLSTPRTEAKENRTIVITCLVTFYVPPCNFIFKRKQSFGPRYKFQFFSKDQCEAPLTRSQNLSLLQKLDWKEVRLIVVNTIRALKDIRAQECILPQRN